MISALVSVTILCSFSSSCGNGTAVTHAEDDTIKTAPTVSAASENSDFTDNVTETVSAVTCDTADDTGADTENEAEYTAGVTSVHHLSYVSMNINNIMQEEIGMPFGCEVVSLAMALKYFGYKIDPQELFFGYMPHGSYGKANPFNEYVGNPTNRTGYGCYAPCVVETANEYLESVGSERRARDISGSSMYELLGYIWSGYPVILWGTLDMAQYSDVLESWFFDGEMVNWYLLSHCVVISGVLGDDFIVCDPMVGKVRYSIEEVEAAYGLIYSQAVVIY